MPSPGNFLIRRVPTMGPPFFPGMEQLFSGRLILEGFDVVAHGDAWPGAIAGGPALVATWWSKWRQRVCMGMSYMCPENSTVLGNANEVFTDAYVRIDHAGSTLCSGPGDDWKAGYSRSFVFDEGTQPRHVTLTLKIRGGPRGGETIRASLYRIDGSGFGLLGSGVVGRDKVLLRTTDSGEDDCVMQESQESRTWLLDSLVPYVINISCVGYDDAAGGDTGYHEITLEEVEAGGTEPFPGGGYTLGELTGDDDWDADPDPAPDPEPFELIRLRYWWPAHNECEGSIASFSTERCFWCRLNAHPDAPAKRYVAKITIDGDRNKWIPQPGEGDGWITHKVYVDLGVVADVLYENGTMGPGCALSNGTDATENTTPGLYAIKLESKSNGAWFDAGFVDYILEIYEEVV